jgi:hypothetical protein
MFTIKLDGGDLVLAQDDREVVRRAVPLDRHLDDAVDAVTDVVTSLQHALDAVVKHAWRTNALTSTDGFHR